MVSQPHKKTAGKASGQPVTQLDKRVRHHGTHRLFSFLPYQDRDVYIPQRCAAHVLLALVNDFVTASFLGDQFSQLLPKLVLVRGIFLDLSESHQDLKLLASEVIIKMRWGLFGRR